MCDIYRKAAHSHATGMYQSQGYRSIRKKKIKWLLFNYCSVFHQFVPEAEPLPCLDDIVFSTPLSEAVCQKQQDSKWDVCTFY